ncbi:MAG: hypothetical protein PF694_03810 [Bacteroidetes bacterium]|jgi:hypothetical protein|nr:hypothetical protein [Bacteroidota bacterium]
MYKKIIPIFSLLVLLSGILFAQKEEFSVYSLKNPTLLKGSSIYFEPLENRGTKDFVDVNGRLQELFTKRTQAPVDNPNLNQLIYGGLFQAAPDPLSADVIVSGYYTAESVSAHDEVAFVESGTHIGSPIPYFEWRITNRASLDVALSFTYPDGTVAFDSVSIRLESEQKPGKKPKPLKELEENSAKAFQNAYYYQFNFIEFDNRWIDFPSVKVKDKQLKDDYKQARSWIKDHELVKLGQLFKRIYEAEGRDEAAVCLGLCYELLGNYPAAAELFEGRSDFHIKARLKKELELYHYLQEIGANIHLVEF